MIDSIDKQLRLLELKCRWPVEHLLAGEYRSVFKGKGIEFEDVRPYEPGDDVRSMDWNVTARTGTPHIKRFIEDREQYIYLLVDVSASMLHEKSGVKRQAIVDMCSLITLSAIKNQDNVGLVLFSEEVELTIPPGKGRSHALRIMDALMNFAPESQGTNLIHAIQYFEHIARRRSVVFIVSDFFTHNFIEEIQTCAHRHDTNAICIRSPIHTLSQPALVRIQDSETGEERVVDPKVAFADRSPENQEMASKRLADFGVNLLNVETDEDSVAALVRFFRERQSGGIRGTNP